MNQRLFLSTTCTGIFSLFINTSVFAAFVPNNADLLFDITNLTRLDTFAITDVSGTSGVGAASTNWTITDTNSWNQRTTTDSTWTYASLPGEATDRLHLGRDFTITFDKNIKSILFAFQDNEGVADGGFDFGIVPDEISGSGISLDGSIIRIGGSGGWALFTGLNTSSFTDNNMLPDGNDISWYVLETAAVPIPGAVWLFGTGLIGLIGMARRKKS